MSAPSSAKGVELVGALGIEPRLNGPKPLVLPLHHTLLGGLADNQPLAGGFRSHRMIDSLPITGHKDGNLFHEGVSRRRNYPCQPLKK